MASEYILVMRNTGYCLIGPFESAEQRRAWLEQNWGWDGPEDPRWQVLAVGDAMAAPMVFTSGSPEAVVALGSEVEFPPALGIE